MIRGVDYVTIEVYGLMQSYEATVEECQVYIKSIKMLDKYDAKVLRHRQDSGFIDIALYPKDADKRTFIKNLKEDGLID